MKDRAREGGFTLIELMVVILIIAILLGAAIPTFLRLRRRAQDTAAQSAASDTIKAERAYYSEGAQDYTDDSLELEEHQPNLRYDTAVNPTCGGFADDKCVQVVLLSPDEVFLVVRSDSGTYWAIRDLARGAGAGTFYNGGGDVAAPVPAAVADTSW